MKIKLFYFAVLMYCKCMPKPSEKTNLTEESVFFGASKICQSCGRAFEYRKKWQANWASVKYCSDSCKKNKNQYDFKEQILNLLKQRDKNKSICPSEVLPPEQKTDKTMMEHVRRSARLLAHDKFIEITQSGKPVDPNNFKGPIRLKMK